jgi:signal recognition particle GTPase
MLRMCADQQPSSNYNFLRKALVWKCSPWDADPVEIAAAAVAKAKAEGHDTVLVDAAGCQVINAD